MITFINLCFLPVNSPVLCETYIYQYEIDKQGNERFIDVPWWYTGEIMRPGFLSAVGGRASWERQIRLQILHRDIQDLARLIISTNRPKKGWEDKQRKKKCLLFGHFNL